LKLKDKNILLISPETWDHIFVSKHHYSVHLAARGNRVYFLNPPRAPFNVQAISATKFQNVFSVGYSGFVKGLRFLPPFMQRFFIWKKFVELEKFCKVKFDVIWSFDNSVFYDFRALPDRVLKISHIVDLNQNFQTSVAAKTADYCFCTTELIKERLSWFTARVFKINHGFNVSDLKGIQKALPGQAKVKALYAGNLAFTFIDWKLLFRLVKSHPAVDFIFIGPGKDHPSVDPNARLVAEQQNTFFLGKIPAGDLQEYYRLADILLICYRDEFHLDQANPHKMMEYLGSGKVIVATFTGEYEELMNQEVIAMSRENSQSEQLFDDVLKNLSFWNSERKIISRKAIASDNTYERQIQRIEKFLDEK